jgi:hypothetical protein
MMEGGLVGGVLCEEEVEGINRLDSGIFFIEGCR